LINAPDNRATDQKVPAIKKQQQPESSSNSKSKLEQRSSN